MDLSIFKAVFAPCVVLLGINAIIKSYLWTCRGVDTAQRLLKAWKCCSSRWCYKCCTSKKLTRKYFARVVWICGTENGTAK